MVIGGELKQIYQWLANYEPPPYDASEKLRKKKSDNEQEENLKKKAKVAMKANTISEVALVKTVKKLNQELKQRSKNTARVEWLRAQVHARTLGLGGHQFSPTTRALTRGSCRRLESCRPSS